jgi:hypothetical protein
MLQIKILKMIAVLVFTIVSACISEYCRGETHHLSAAGWQSRGESLLSTVPRPPSPVPAASPLSGVTVQAYGNTGGVPTAAAQWTWSPAAPWHACMVRVQCGAAAGSGVYVHCGGVRFVLTAQHVIADGGQTTCRWIDGSVSQALDQTADKYGHDVAAIRLRDYHEDVEPLPVAQRTPEPGEWMEVCGYGGGGVRLRNYYVQVVEGPGFDDGSGVATPGPIHGDSGGGVLTADEEGVLCVATVVSAGAGGSVNGLGDNHAYEQLHYPSPEAVSDFARRAAVKWGGGREGLGARDAGRGNAQAFGLLSPVPRPPSLVPAQYDEAGCPPGGCPLPRRRQAPPQDDGWFPRGEPYRIGPRRRGDIDIEINGRDREPYEEDDNGKELLIGLGVIAIIGFAAVAFNFKQRI